jgi:hypothetical protein
VGSPEGRELPRDFAGHSVYAQVESLVRSRFRQELTVSLPRGLKRRASVSPQTSPHNRSARSAGYSGPTAPLDCYAFHAGRLFDSCVRCLHLTAFVSRSRDLGWRISGGIGPQSIQWTGSGREVTLLTCPVLHAPFHTCPFSRARSSQVRCSDPRGLVILRPLLSTDLGITPAGRQPAIHWARRRGERQTTAGRP